MSFIHCKAKVFFICLMSMFISITFSSCAQMCLVTGHDYSAATCLSPQTCINCGEVAGEALGHNWEAATCTDPRTCTTCGEQTGDALSNNYQHTWVSATCVNPKTCSVCGETEGSANGHEFSNTGVCVNCDATKEFKNSYGYFSSSEIYSMAQHALKEALYPAYVNDFAASSEIVLEEADTTLYGADCFVIVCYADVTKNGKTSQQYYAVVVKPQTSTTYTCIDMYAY